LRQNEGESKKKRKKKQDKLSWQDLKKKSLFFNNEVVHCTMKISIMQRCLKKKKM